MTSFFRLFVPLFLLAPLLGLSQPKSAIGQLGLEGLGVQGMDSHGVTREMISVNHPAHSTALRVQVPTAVPAKIHQIQVNVPNRAPIAADDVVLVRLTLRSAGPEGSRVQSQLYIQDSTEGYRSLGNRIVEAGSAWEEVEFLVPVKKAYFRNELNFALFLGQAAQTVDLVRFDVWNLGAQPDDATLARLRAGAVITHDFEAPFPPLFAQTGSRARTTGHVPPGWEEDSAWAEVAVNYGATRQNPFGGEQSFRVEADTITKGQIQFRLPTIILDPAYQIRLRLATRSPTSTLINVALRQREAPYRTYWKSTFPAAPEWGVVEALATTPVNDPNAVLVFDLDKPGVIELDDLSLTYLTHAQALGSRTFEGNLLPSSSFPLGLSAPWAGGGNGKPDTTYVADPAVPGPSGLPSLRMTTFVESGRPVAQLTAPFEGRPASAHTFSFWARAAHTGHKLAIRVGAPEEKLWVAPWQKTVDLTETWRRYHFTVTLPPAPEGFYLARLNTHESGTIWVDQLMVEASPTLSDFKPVDRVELAAVAAAPFGLGFEATPLAYTVAAHGDLHAVARVAVTVRDLYGKTYELPPLTGKPAGTLLTLSGNLPASAELPRLGTVLLEFVAQDALGNALSRPSELLLHRVRRPHHLGRTAPESAFGTHIFASASEAAMAKALGFNWVRTNYKINWSRVEPQPGKWTWDSLDAELATYRDHHLTTLAYLGGVPRRASVARDDWPSTWWRMTAAPREDALDGWQEYARRIFERYGDSIRAFETWNEPFLPGFFPADVQQGRPVRASAELFYQMMLRVRAAATEANYTGRLLWNMGAAYGDSELAFDRQNVALGTAALMDGFTFHRYTNVPLAFPGDQFQQDTRTLFATLGKHAHTGGALWNSEGGYGLSELFNLYRHSPPTRMRDRADLQAGNLVRYYLSNFAAGVERVFIYSFFPGDEWRSNYSYLHADGQLSQAATAFSNLAWQLEGKRFARSVALGGDAQAMLFAAEGDRAPVVALTGRGLKPLQLTGLPEGIEAYDLYGNHPTLPTPLGVGVLFFRGEGLTPEALAPHLK